MNIGILAALAAGGGGFIDDLPLRPRPAKDRLILEYQRRQRAFEDAVRPRLIADSRTIRAERLELRRGLPDGKLFVRRRERGEAANAVRAVRTVAP